MCVGGGTITLTNVGDDDRVENSKGGYMVGERIAAMTKTTTIMGVESPATTTVLRSAQSSTNDPPGDTSLFGGGVDNDNNNDGNNGPRFSSSEVSTTIPSVMAATDQDTQTMMTKEDASRGKGVGMGGRVDATETEEDEDQKAEKMERMLMKPKSKYREKYK